MIMLLKVQLQYNNNSKKKQLVYMSACVAFMYGRFRNVLTMNKNHLHTTS